MEPHTLDPAHELREPHQEGVFGPLLGIDVADARVWQEGSVHPGKAAQDPAVNARLVWVGSLVAVVSVGVEDARLPAVAQALRAFLGQPQLPVVFSRGWLPGKVGSVIATESPPTVAGRELARAEAYALVQTRWFQGERVLVQLGTDSFEFEVRSVLDAADRVQVTLR
jgi:hypothetical protein